MSDVDLAGFAAATAAHLHAMLSAIDKGEMDATATMRARIEGAAIALDAISSGDPWAALGSLAGGVTNDTNPSL
ncbi:MAG: hypothetical protein ACRDT5_23435 [Mycobacterium sp.]